MEQEIQRYDWVIHLDTAEKANYQSSQVRIEENSTALEINQKIKTAWRAHPNRIIVPNHTHFIEKLNRVLNVVNLIMTGASTKDILNSF